MKNEKQDAKKSLYERLTGIKDRVSVGTRDMVVLRGKRGGTVYGCRKILQYSPIEIRLQLSGTVVSLEGQSLYCTSFGAGTVTVEGDVHRATYLPKNG